MKRKIDRRYIPSNVKKKEKNKEEEVDAKSQY